MMDMEPHKMLGALLVTLVVGLVGGAVIEHKAPEGAKPIENVIEPALSLAEPDHPFCRAGWTAKVINTLDTVAFNCLRDDWTLVVDTNDGSFITGQRKGDSKSYAEHEVPNW